MAIQPRISILTSSKDMAEYGYGYRSGFEKHAPLFNGVVSEAVPQLNDSEAKPNVASAEVKCGQ